MNLRTHEASSDGKSVAKLMPCCGPGAMPVRKVNKNALAPHRVVPALSATPRMK